MNESLVVYATLDNGNKIVYSQLSGITFLSDNNLNFIKPVPEVEDMIKLFCRQYNLED